MSWTYQEFMSQPAWFIALLEVKLGTEARYEKDSIKKK